jgi:glycine amidinotransferase
MHIDATFIPLAPGKLLVNPTYPCITGVPVKTIEYEAQKREYLRPTMIRGPPIGRNNFVNAERALTTSVPVKSFSYKGEKKEYRLPAMFKGWDVFVAQTPMLSTDHPLYFTSPWTASCNIIMLDHV